MAKQEHKSVLKSMLTVDQEIILPKVKSVATLVVMEIICAANVILVEHMKSRKAKMVFIICLRSDILFKYCIIFNIKTI